MVIQNKVVIFELTAVFRLDLPIQECTERVALHEAVKQTANLTSPPYKFALDSGQYKFVTLNLVKGFFDGSSGLIDNISPKISPLQLSEEG